MRKGGRNVFPLDQRLHSTLCGGVGDIPADNLVFVYQKRGIYRLGSSGKVGYLVYIAHYGFFSVLTQVVTGTFLQRVVAAEDLIFLLGNPYLSGFCRGCVYLPAQILQKLYPPIVAGQGRRSSRLRRIAPSQQKNQRQGMPPQANTSLAAWQKSLHHWAPPDSQLR